MPHRSTFLAPLHNLLKKDMPWKWSKVEDAFVAAKQLILNPQTLSFMWCFIPWCWSRSVSSDAFATCTLTKAQQNYSQLEKKALSIIFGMKRFRQYLSMIAPSQFQQIIDLCDSFWTIASSSCSCSSSTSKMDTYACIIQLNDWVPQHYSTCRCRQDVPSSSPDMVTKM